MFALQASLAAVGRATIQPGMTSVDLPVRGFITTDDDGRQSVNFVRTGVGGVSPSVPVFRPVRDELTGLDKITLPAVAGAPARTILINPVPTGPAAPAHTGNGSPGPKSPVHTGTGIRQADSIVVTTFPADVVQDLQDFILWQPDALETGVEAVYVMVRSPRYTPGKVSGKGQQVGDGWLNTAGQELGSPVPSQIADKLRGREFASFDAFRKAFWTEVGKDPELSKQFRGNNLENLKNGYSPFSPKSERVGERARFELHHIRQIKDGGAVYDVDNLGVMTPKRHIDIHKEGK
nr:S-type pyocin domain-containing protein [Serratia marcescens]